MPDHNIRRLGRSTCMGPSPRQQFEGQSTIKFKLSLVDGPSYYHVTIHEVDTGVESVLYSSITFLAAQQVHQHYVQNIVNTNMYRVLGSIEGPKRGRTIMFELLVLPTWSFPNE